MSTWKVVKRRLLSLVSEATPLTLLGLALAAAVAAGAVAYAFVGLLHLLAAALGWQLQTDGSSSGGGGAAEAVSARLRTVASSVHHWGVGGVLAAFARGVHHVPAAVPLGASRGSTDNLGSVDYLGAQLDRFPIDVVYTWVNGSDPRLQKQLFEYKRDMGLLTEEEIADAAKTEEQIKLIKEKNSSMTHTLMRTMCAFDLALCRSAGCSCYCSLRLSFVLAPLALQRI
jgi:hypothetical protein